MSQAADAGGERAAAGAEIFRDFPGQVRYARRKNGPLVVRPRPIWRLYVPTIGVAKSLLVGTYEEPLPTKGSWSAVRIGEDIVGAVLRTRGWTRPVFVSPGHLVDVESAVSIVLAATGRVRLPEPCRIANVWSRRLARGTSNCFSDETVERS